MTSTYDHQRTACHHPRRRAGTQTGKRVDKETENVSYKPNYTDDDIENASESVNLSGRSPKNNLEIEESNQRRIAESEMWMIARESDISRQEIEALGFHLTESRDELFYEAAPPLGWTKTTNGYWATIRDADGIERAQQFYKGAWYDRRAFIRFK